VHGGSKGKAERTAFKCIVARSIASAFVEAERKIVEGGNAAFR